MSDPVKTRDEKRQSGEWRSRIGVALRHVRTARRLTQTELADAIGVDVNTISNTERGLSAPDYATIEALAEVLKVDLRVITGFVNIREAIERDILPPEERDAFAAVLAPNEIIATLRRSLPDVQEASVMFREQLAAELAAVKAELAAVKEDFGQHEKRLAALEQRRSVMPRQR